jgi:phenylalanyl-tRNA synthetase beta chain
MRISLSWLGDYVELPAGLTPAKLAHDLTMSTVEVEHVDDLAAPLDHVVVARVRVTTPHPDADRLRVVRLDDGQGERTVVCGASNVAAGMLVALARPGARCRGKDGASFEIGVSDVRGIVSAGMICSSSELGLGDLLPCKDDEIIDLGDLGHPDLAPGTPLATAIHFDDVVLEIDNKSLTNRPDLWGHYGVAREVAALYGLPLQPLPSFAPTVGDGGFVVDIADPERCARYTATHIHGVRTARAPLWLRSRLVKVGQRPINLLVDLTNYVMMAVGQPSHAFDARDLPTRVEVRRARQGEPLTLLDGTKPSLDPECLVIANHERPVALAGVMGGDAAVRGDTDALWLEIANFDPVEIRRIVRRFGVRTESSSRFEKGIDPDRVVAALGLFVNLLVREQPTAQVVAHVDSFPRPLPVISVDVDVAFLHRRLGRELPEAQMRGLLERLGFVVEGEGRLAVRVPSWRATGDVSLPEDIVEEVARLYGYEALGFSPPIVALVAPVIQPRRRMERRLKEALAFQAGMREVVSYPWVSAALLDASGMAGVPTVGLAHAPTADMRLAPSLVPQLLGLVASNLRYFDAFSIFELDRVFSPELVPTPGVDERLPMQPRKLAAALVGPDAAQLFYRAKGVIESLARAVQCEPIGFSRDVEAPWGDPAARLGLTTGGRGIGALAVVSSRAKRKAGIRGAEVAMFELDVDSLTPYSSRHNELVPLPTFPQVDFDINVVVERSVEWADLQRIAAVADPLVRQVSFVDEYVGEQVPAGHKSVTLRLRLGSDAGTLVRAQIDAAAGQVIAALREHFQAVVRD